MNVIDKSEMGIPNDYVYDISRTWKIPQMIMYIWGKQWEEKHV